MRTIGIVGSSGYIGRHLVASLVSQGHWRIRLLCREQTTSHPFAGKVEVVNGDLLSPASLEGFLEPGCTVVNLVYLWGASEDTNLAAMRNLVAACKAAGVKRLIHVSTAAVVGRVDQCLVTETTPCRPISEYGVTKLNIENFIRSECSGSFDFAIVRPTSVFGPAGDPLKKLAGNLADGRRMRNYLKSCLFGKRRMNLVHVKNVVAAIEFLVDRSEALGGEVFIVSDDDDEANNFADVESVLMAVFGLKGGRIPKLHLPLAWLTLLLRLMGRNNINPRCNYDPGKLLALGFARPVNFAEGLEGYARWYSAAHWGNRDGGQVDADP